MKKLAGLLVLLLILTGCRSASGPLHRAIAFRAELLEGEGCTFDAKVTADYGDLIHSFSMACQADAAGALSFTVTEPESIRGITGTLSAEGGELTFDGTALHFELMAEGVLSPVSAPWIFLNTLRGGYLTSACQEGELLHISADDSYREDALHLDIRLDNQDTPVSAEILHKNRRILTLELQNFRILSP